jgi:hypothetical protein
MCRAAGLSVSVEALALPPTTALAVLLPDVVRLARV